MVSRWIAVAAAAALAACSSGTEVAPPVSVSAVVSPAPNAAGVPRGAAITMDVGIVMDTTWCTGRMLLQVGDSMGPLVSAQMTWANGNRRMILQPSTTLAPMTTYFVHVRDSMMTTSGGMGGGGMNGMRPMMFDQPPSGGMRMSDGMGWSFTTGP